MTKTELIFECNAVKAALAAVLHEADLMGVDVNRLLERTKSGLFDSGKPYRLGPPQIVVPAIKAIDEAVRAVRE